MKSSGLNLRLFTATRSFKPMRYISRVFTLSVNNMQ